MKLMSFVQSEFRKLCRDIKVARCKASNSDYYGRQAIHEYNRLVECLRDFKRQARDYNFKY